MKKTIYGFISVVTIIGGICNTATGQTSLLKSDIGLELYTSTVKKYVNFQKENSIITPKPSFSGGFNYNSYIAINQKNYIKIGVGVGLETYSFEVVGLIDEGVAENFNQFYTTIPFSYMRLWKLPQKENLFITTNIGFEAAFYDYGQTTSTTNHPQGLSYELETENNQDYGNITATAGLGVLTYLKNGNALSIYVNKRLSSSSSPFYGTYTIKQYSSLAEFGHIYSKREQFTLKVTYAFTTKAN